MAASGILEQLLAKPGRKWKEALSAIHASAEFVQQQNGIEISDSLKPKDKATSLQTP